MHALNTADRLELLASETPDRAAFIGGDRTITYAQFSRDIARFTAALRDVRLPPGSTAVVGCADVYIHWLLLLAFERLNVATGSIDVTESAATHGELLAGADLVLGDENVNPPGGVRHFPITRAWVRDTLASTPEESAVRAPQSPTTSCVSSVVPARPDAPSAWPSPGACTSCARRAMGNAMGFRGIPATS